LCCRSFKHSRSTWSLQSSLLNKLSHRDGGHASKLGKSGKGSPLKPGITTSSLPGTTLSFLRLGVGDGVSLVDTPGIILAHQLTARLLPEELKAVLPTKRMDYVTLRVGEGKAVCLGSLARVELVSGRPFFLTFFVAAGVTVHGTPAPGADAFARRHAGGLLSPPFDAARLDDLGPLVAHDIKVRRRARG